MIKEIIEGFRNLIDPPVDQQEEIEAVAKARISICRSCPYNSRIAETGLAVRLRPDEHCTDCGCNLAAKTRCITCSCPQKKW